MRKQVATYITEKSRKKLDNYIREHPEITVYKALQKIIEEGVEKFDRDNKNKNGSSAGHLSGNPEGIIQQKTGSGELEG
jgi:hypothetical protein